MSQSGELDVIASHPEIPTQFDADVGVAIPINNVLEIKGAPGSNISTTASGNTVLINVSGITHWQTIIASQAMTSDNGYICIAPGGALSLSLPAVSTVGAQIEITLDGSTKFTVTQGAGQSIRLGNLATTAGVGGSVASTQQGDSLRMVCSVANLKWNVVSSMGNPTIV